MVTNKKNTIEKNWQILPQITEDFSAKFPEINPVILQLLFNRDLDNQEKIDQFLNPDYGSDLYDPFLFSEMEKVVKRIFLAIEKQEKIVVYGDYDADGVCSSVVMVETLKNFGAQVEVYIPFRETEGYGLNLAAAKELINQGVNLVITVDCGISNKNEVELLNQGGVDVIITDHHHQPLELPKAFAIINQNLTREKYPFKKLAGCGVAFKVVQGLITKQAEYKIKQLPEGFEKWLLDLVAIGTIADLQPLLGENRVLVKYGLVVLNKTKRLGILKLIEKIGNHVTVIDERMVGWQISPRLNAAGRLNHASSAYQLLLTENAAEADQLAIEINQTNQQRQQITDKINLEAKEKIGKVDKQKILIVVGENWPTGVVGLVAGRLTDNHHLPSLVISRYNGEIIGSGRSIAEFNLIEAIQKCDECLSRYGGHGQAAGFTLKDEKFLAKFIEKITKLAETKLKEKELKPILEIDSEINLNQLDWQLVEEIEKFIPYGEENPKPKFLIKDLTIIDCQLVGQDGKHLRLTIGDDQISKKAIGFSFGEWFSRIKKGDKIDLISEIEINEWNGNRELQLKIVDLRQSHS